MLYFEDLKIDLSESSKPTLLAPTPEVEISGKSIRFLARLEADLRSQLGLEMIEAHSQGAVVHEARPRRRIRGCTSALGPASDGA
ncbi:MAG TPA: hypothetical protein VLE23_13170 [Geminicoccaceae bacterium]|nr:hypothetical protein [Geminicoccaceae bacterium]